MVTDLPNEDIRLLHGMWRHRFRFLLGVLLAIAAGVTYYFKGTKIYESSAEVLVINKRPEAVTAEDQGATQFEDYMSTHRALISSDVVLSRAVADAELGSLTCFSDLPPEADLAQTIKGALLVAGGAKSLGRGADNILDVSFRSTDPDDSAAVVRAILASYQAYLEETYRDMTADTVELISEAHSLLVTDLNEQEAQYRAFRESSPVITSDNSAQATSNEQLRIIQSERANLMLRRAELQTQLDTIKRAVEEGQDENSLVHLIAKWDMEVSLRRRSPDDNALSQEMLRLQNEEKQLLETMGGEHPQIVAIRREIAETQRFFSDEETEVVGHYRDYLRQEIERLGELIEQLNALYDQEHKHAKELEIYLLRDAEFLRKFTRTQQTHDSVIRQLQEASIVRDYGGFRADIISPPRPGAKVEPQALRCFGAAIVLGVVLGTLLAYVAHVADQSFHNPDEIKNYLGLPVLGHIPHFGRAARRLRKATPELDPFLCTYFSPNSPETEAYREVRTALFFARRRKNAKVLQMAGPKPGEGKSTLAANLSLCMAQSGQSVVLIDADMRKPRQHMIFGLPSEQGLSTVLTDECEVEDAIQPTGIANLSLMPAGPLPPAPSELLSSSRFPELLDLLRDKYDYVLIDTGPILLLSDPRIVAGHVDGVVMTLRMSTRSKSQAEQAKDMLTELGAEVLGVVVNGVGARKSHGYRYDRLPSEYKAYSARSKTADGGPPLQRDIKEKASSPADETAI